MTMVRTKYDREADALYVRLSDRPVARTVEVTDLHMVDLDASGAPVGIEILAPGDPRLEEIAARFGLDELLPAIRDAVEGATALTCTASGAGNLLISFERATFCAEDFTIPAYTRLVSASASGTALARPVEELVLAE